MATIKIVGQTKVGAIKKKFKEEIGVDIQIYDQDGNSASSDVTLGSMRTKTPNSTALKIVGQSKVKKVEDYFNDNYGVKVDILNPDGSFANNESTLGDIRRLYGGKRKDSSYDGVELEELKEENGEMITLTFNIDGARDLNIYYEDFTIEDLKDRNLIELYEEIKESFEDERESFIYHEEGLDNVIIEESDAGECEFKINTNNFKLDDNKVRVIWYYYYDDTEYTYCDMQLAEGKEIEITVNSKEIFEGFEYVGSIVLIDGFNEDSEDAEIYFEIENASPSDEEAAMDKVVVCTDKGIIDHFVIDDESDPAERFEKAIKSIF